MKLTKLTTLPAGSSIPIHDLDEDRLGELQTALTKLGYPLGDIDGLYGPKTRNAWAECVEDFKLGDPLTIPFHQIDSGALLIFAFFMISDPKTTPDKRGARILYAVLVAAFAHYLVFWRYIPEGLMYALFFLSPLVPLMDRIRPISKEHRFSWARPTV